MDADQNSPPPQSPSSPTPSHNSNSTLSENINSPGSSIDTSAPDIMNTSSDSDTSTNVEVNMETNNSESHATEQVTTPIHNANGKRLLSRTPGTPEPPESSGSPTTQLTNNTSDSAVNMDNTIWQTVTKGGSGQHKDKKNRTDDNTASAFVSKNPFDPLSGLNPDDSIASQHKATVSQQRATNIPRRDRAPAIYLYELNDFQSINLMINNKYGNEVEIRHFPDHFRYKATTMAQYKELIVLFKDRHYYTYQPFEARPLKVVIKGLHPLIKEEDIKKELTERGFVIEQVHQYKRYDHTTKDTFKLSTYCVNLTHNEKAKEIYKVTRLCLLTVHIEAYRSDARVPQCGRCQRHGHTKAYCKLPFRCARCGGPHETDKCQRDKNTPPTCVNCNDSHSANFRGCANFIKYAESAAARKKGASTTNETEIKVTTGRTFESKIIQQAESGTTMQQRNTQLHPSPGGSYAATTRDGFITPPSTGNAVNTPAKAQETTTAITNVNSTENSTVASKTTTSSTSEDIASIRELLQMLKGLNIREIVNTLKDTLKRAREETSPVQKLLILAEGVLPLIDNAAP